MFTPGTKLGPCWSHIWTLLNHVWPSYMSRLTRALKFSRLGEYGLSIISIVSTFWDHFGPGFNKVHTMFSIKLLLFNFLHNLSVCRFSHILTQLLQWQSCRPLVLFSYSLHKWLTCTNKLPCSLGKHSL